MNYEEIVNDRVKKAYFLDDFLNHELLDNHVYAVVQNRNPDLPDTMRFVGIFKSADEAVDYSNKIFDAYNLKGRADAFRVDVLEYKFDYSCNYFSFVDTFYNIVKFGD